MKKKTKIRWLSLFMLLATLTVAVAVLVPIWTAADAEEIANFGFQTLSALDLPNDEDTDLRFLFTIGSLDYEEVGFVFSKTNESPTIGGATCYKAPTTSVHSTVTANGVPNPAPAGRWWVAVKLTDIPHEYFDGSLYIRPYVDDGEVRYGEAAALTVCSAAKHKHEIDETAHKMSGGTAALNREGTKIGHCDGCNLDNVTEYDATTEFEYQKWTGGGSKKAYRDDWDLYEEVLKGGTLHFYPDVSNGGQGNDLLIEYSILWNESLLDLTDAFIDTRLCNSETGEAKGVCYMSISNDASGSDFKYAGGFEYAGLPNRAPDGVSYTSEYMTKGNVGGAYVDCPNVGGRDRNNPEYGWHRISIRVHQEVTNLDALLADESGEPGAVAAEYYLTSTVYVDGVPISKLCGTDLLTQNTNYDRKLYTATSTGAGGVTYGDVRYVDNADPSSGTLYLMAYSVNSVQALTTGRDAYLPIGDTFVTCGHDFVQNVAKVENPEARTETVGGKSIYAPFYYTTYGEHVHTWDGDFVDVQGATLLESGWSAEHCTVCGEMNKDTAAEKDVLFVPHVEKWTENSSGKYIVKTRIRQDMLDGGAIFQPETSDSGDSYGNDLLIEYSILWNPTLANLRHDVKGTYDTFLSTTLLRDNNSQHNNLAYMSLTDDNPDADCAYAGGFEYGSFRTSETGNPYPNMTPPAGDLYSDFPNIGGTNQASPEWGWHRVGIRVHEEVTNLAEVKASDVAAQYKLTATIYLDGEVVSILSDNLTNFNSNNLLYTAKHAAKSPYVSYSAINTNRLLWILRVNSTTAQAGKTVYFAVADYYATCGKEFVQAVKKVPSPDAVDYEIADGVHVNAAKYYTSAPTVLELTEDEDRYTLKLPMVKEVQKGKHFYPTEENPAGNDLYVEYSLLWNETLVDNLVSTKQYLDTRIGNFYGASSNALSYVSLTNGNTHGDCQYAGGWEYTSLNESEEGNPYPRMIGKVADPTAYPNIGGSNPGDGVSHGDTQWGWHRIGMKLHEELTNKAAVSGGAAATYRVTCELYIDGVLVSILGRNAGDGKWLEENLLYTAQSDGQGGITYSDMAATKWLFIFFANNPKTETGETAYFIYKDVFATCGQGFVQDVTKVPSPTAASYTLPDSTVVSGKTWYRTAPPIRLTRGATASVETPTGLCFSGVVDRAYINELKSTYGENAVEVGVLVTPTANLTDNSLDFTVEALDGCNAIAGEKYVKLEASFEGANANASRFSCVLTGLQAQDYGRLYSARGYVEVNGDVVCYSSYEEAVNSAVLSDVAEAALWELSSTQSEKYNYECTLPGDILKYSPYTTAQRETLAGFRVSNYVTVMSYNIAVYDSPSGGQGWEGRDPSKVAETVLSESPDIVGFQEVNQKGVNGWNSTLSSLASAGGYTRLTGSYTGKYDFEKNEIFYKTDKFTKVTEGTKTFQQTASQLGVPNTEGADQSLDTVQRIFHYVVLTHKATGKNILVVNTHLHYGGTGSGHEEDDKVRRYEIRTLLAWLETQSATYPDQIVLGDMNAHYNASNPSNGGTLNMQVFFDAGFERTSDTARVRGDRKGTLASNNRTGRDTRYTFDYVLTRGNFRTLYYTVVDNPIDADDTYPSDHIPVMAEIRFR